MLTGYVRLCVHHDERQLIAHEQNYAPKNVKVDHVAPDVPLARIKDRLSQVRGALVECPLVSTAAP